MRRAVHILFWFSVIAAIVVAVRRGKQPLPPATAKLPFPEQAVATAATRLAPPDAAPVHALVPELRGARATMPAPTAPRTEADFMGRIRDNVRANPEVAVALAQQARQEFGDTIESDERDKLLVDALINLQRIGVARDETLYYYRRHPAGQYRQYLWAMTGARPNPPSGPAQHK
jgi:hypothetical protein